MPLTIWFAFGGLGLPAHGAVGCAWATVVVNYLFLACAIWLLRTQPLISPTLSGARWSARLARDRPIRPAGRTRRAWR